MEGYGYDSVSEVEGFLNFVIMVDVNINVEYSRVVFGVRAKLGFEVEVNFRKKKFLIYFY